MEPFEPFGWTDTVTPQYANSPTMTGLMGLFSEYFDQAENYNLFYDYVWNVLTAQGYGLDVWGRIVGVQRVLSVPTGNYFGFNGSGAQPFGQAPFWSYSPVTSNYALSDSAFRVLILAKALANITDGSIPGFNQILINLFSGRGNAFVADGQNMTLTYIFLFELMPFELAILQQSGVLPRPTGVLAYIQQYDIAGGVFGFAGSGLMTFGHGAFVQGTINAN